jgi:hypothetical protein
MFVPSLSWQNDRFIYKWLENAVFRRILVPDDDQLLPRLGATCRADGTERQQQPSSKSRASAQAQTKNEAPESFSVLVCV